MHHELRWVVSVLGGDVLTRAQLLELLVVADYLSAHVAVLGSIEGPIGLPVGLFWPLDHRFVSCPVDHLLIPRSVLLLAVGALDLLALPECKHLGSVVLLAPLDILAVQEIIHDLLAVVGRSEGFLVAVVVEAGVEILLGLHDDWVLPLLIGARSAVGVGVVDDPGNVLVSEVLSNLGMGHWILGVVGLVNG